MKNIDFELIKAGGRRGEVELNELIELNKGYITKFAYSYLGRAKKDGKAIDIEDLKSTATLGMIMSVKKYNPNKGKFLSWATNYMKSAIYDYCGLSYSQSYNEDFYDSYSDIEEDDSFNEDLDTFEERPDCSIDYEPDSEEVPIGNYKHSVNTGYEGGEKVPFSDDSADYSVCYKDIIERIKRVLNKEEFTIFCRYRGLAGHKATDLPVIAKEMKISLLHAQCAYSHSLCELRIDDD